MIFTSSDEVLVAAASSAAAAVADAPSSSVEAVATAEAFTKPRRLIFSDISPPFASLCMEGSEMRRGARVEESPFKAPRTASSPFSFPFNCSANYIT